MINYSFKPIYSKNSKILILGSFPSVKSRKDNFYYAHPQNRFWKLIASIFDEKIPKTTDEKRQVILDNNLAIWDVIKSCEICGSSDSSIKNVESNNVNDLIVKTKASKVIFNGKKASEVYYKYNKQMDNIKYIILPSTSPANANYSFEKLYNIWKKEIEE